MKNLLKLENLLLEATAIEFNQFNNANNELSPIQERKIQSALEFGTFYKIKYLSGNKKITGFLAVPKIKSESNPENLPENIQNSLQGIVQKYPCIIFNRGGAKEFAKNTAESFVMGFGGFVKAGYIVIASQYSGNDGSEGRDEFGGVDLQDVLVLKDVLGDLTMADTSKIGMYGVSRGGMMTYLSLTRVDWIKAAVTVGGTANLFTDYNLRPNLLQFRGDMYDVHSDAENKKRSAVFWADQFNNDTKLLILHGSNDEGVAVSDSLELAKSLSEHQKPFAMHIFEGGSHSLKEFGAEKQNMILNWFQKYL